MDEFIVWDKVFNRFADITEIKFTNSYVIARRRPYHDEDVEWVSCGMNSKDFEIFKSIGKTDTEGNKIYADCSIFEFCIPKTDFNNYEDGKLKPKKVSVMHKGYFTYDKDKLAYIIKTKKDWFFFGVCDIEDLKVIGTLQQDKYLLGED